MFSIKFGHFEDLPRSTQQCWGVAHLENLSMLDANTMCIFTAWILDVWYMFGMHSKNVNNIWVQFQFPKNKQVTPTQYTRQLELPIS